MAAAALTEEGVAAFGVDGLRAVDAFETGEVVG